MVQRTVPIPDLDFLIGEDFVFVALLLNEYYGITHRALEINGHKKILTRDFISNRLNTIVIDNKIIKFVSYG